MLSASVGLVDRWSCFSASAAKLASPFLSFLRFFFPNCCFMYNAKFLRDRSTLVSMCSLSFNESVDSHHSMWSEVQIFFCYFSLFFALACKSARQATISSISNVFFSFREIYSNFSELIRPRKSAKRDRTKHRVNRRLLSVLNSYPIWPEQQLR